MTALDRLAQERYVLLTTYRKDGRGVPTPVWAVRDGDALAVWTPTNTGKVKRVRGTGRVTVAPCDFGGTVLGESVDGSAVVVGPQDTERVRRLLSRKYGLVGWLSVWGSRIRRGRAGTVAIMVKFES